VLAGVYLLLDDHVLDLDGHGESDDAADGVEAEVVSAFHGVGVEFFLPALEFGWWWNIFESSSHFVVCEIPLKNRKEKTFKN